MRAEATHLERLAEAPRLQAQPREVFVRVAAVDELPVDHRGQAVGLHDDVAHPEVAVDQRVGGVRRPVREQPFVGAVEHRAALVEPLVLVPDRHRVGGLGAGHLGAGRSRASRRGTRRVRARGPCARLRTRRRAGCAGRWSRRRRDASRGRWCRAECRRRRAAPRERADRRACTRASRRPRAASRPGCRVARAGRVAG